jgi:hypothetical protein
MGNITEGRAIERAQFWIDRLKIRVKNVKVGGYIASIRMPFCALVYSRLRITPDALRDLTEEELDFAIVNGLYSAKFVNVISLGMLLNFPFLLGFLYILIFQKVWLHSMGMGMLWFMPSSVILVVALLFGTMRWSALIECKLRFKATLNETPNLEAARNCVRKASKYQFPIPHPMFLSPETTLRCLEQVTGKSVS